MDRIIIHRTTHGYVAEWQERNGDEWKPSQHVMDLFGTWVIPTPFTQHAEPKTVLSRIVALNPGTMVQLA